MFGINLKKYIAFAKKEPKLQRKHLDPSNLTETETLDIDKNEGAYLFKPNWRNPLPVQYSTLNQDVIYQKGNTIQQWTLSFQNQTTKELALIKVRYSKLMKELIEFEVELSPIPVADDIGKDVTVNWKLYDGFNINRTFWTDSNGLEM